MVNVRRLARKMLGEILIEEGLVTQEQVQEALRKQQETAELLGECLVRLGFVQETDIARALAKQFGLPFIEADQYDIQRDVVSLIPSDMMLHNGFIVLDKIGKVLTVAVSGVISAEVFEDLERRTGSEVFVFVSTGTQVRNALRKFVRAPDGGGVE
ncbi:MAG: GspE/PulE/PilB domain-containing protein [Planctomycetota bacterium]|jgi:type IV pilus assembly protein PilB